MDEELSKEVSAHGFPVEHKHKLCCLRQELIDNFVDSRYMLFIKYAAFHLQQLNMPKNTDLILNKDRAIQDKNEIEMNDENENKENNVSNDEKKDESKKEDLETEEAKKIVESITAENKVECK